jgi:hypothetical protein
MGNFAEMNRRIQWSEIEFSHSLSPEPTADYGFTSAFAVDSFGGAAQLLSPLRTP